MSHHRVEFHNVFYTYPDGNKAIKNISFQVHHGESVGLVGANGAGKSSILKLLTGIILPDDGEIRVGELLLTKKTLPFIRQSIGFTFQDPDHQLFMSSVYDDVAFGPRNYKMDEAEVEKVVTKALETVGALHLKDRPPYKLSGGEKRAVAIASVLAIEPDILVMDEPSVALDPRARRRLINLLKNFSHTKIIATHDLDMVLELCERVIVIRNGEIMRDGLTVEILTNEDFLKECSLEMPLSLQNCPIYNSSKIMKHRNYFEKDTI